MEHVQLDYQDIDLQKSMRDKGCGAPFWFNVTTFLLPLMAWLLMQTSPDGHVDFPFEVAAMAACALGAFVALAGRVAGVGAFAAAVGIIFNVMVFISCWWETFPPRPVLGGG